MDRNGRSFLFSSFPTLRFNTNAITSAFANAVTPASSSSSSTTSSSPTSAATDQASSPIATFTPGLVSMERMTSGTKDSIVLHCKDCHFRSPSPMMQTMTTMTTMTTPYLSLPAPSTNNVEQVLSIHHDPSTPNSAPQSAPQLPTTEIAVRMERKDDNRSFKSEREQQQSARLNNGLPRVDENGINNNNNNNAGHDGVNDDGAVSEEELTKERLELRLYDAAPSSNVSSTSFRRASSSSSSIASSTPSSFSVDNRASFSSSSTVSSTSSRKEATSTPSASSRSLSKTLSKNNSSCSPSSSCSSSTPASNLSSTSIFSSPLPSWSRKMLAVVFVFLMSQEMFLQPVEGCGPGRGRSGPRISRKRKPLVYRQHVPNVAENTLGASGLPEGAFGRSDKRFRDLVENRNSDIIFRDEEKTGADRMMTQRAKDKLNSLAIYVMNQWPGIRLRVTEAFDEDGSHSPNSLHYEGRAVDITTSDRNRAKYGMLARLAVEAGFDWVYYENRAHIHCSVKSDSSAAIKSGGCFAGDNEVLLADGTRKSMSSLSLGDRVLALDDAGKPTFSPILAFLDRRPEGDKFFYSLSLSNGASLELTPSHLIYAAPNNASFDEAGVHFQSLVPVFARDVQVGQYVYVVDPNVDDDDKDDNNNDIGVGNERAKPVRVTGVTTLFKAGAYAPMTETGSIVVNGIVASSYAIFENHWLTHWAMTPLRSYYRLLDIFGVDGDRAEVGSQDGLHWYSTFLYNFADFFLPKDLYEAWFYNV